MILEFIEIMLMIIGIVAIDFAPLALVLYISDKTGRSFDLCMLCAIAWIPLFLMTAFVYSFTEAMGGIP